MDFLGLFFGLFPEKPIFTSEKNRFISGKHLIFEDLDLFYWAMEDVMERDDLCGGTAKTRDQPFCDLRKSKTGNFSVVTLQVATLKFPVLVFFAIHQKYSTGCFGTAALCFGTIMFQNKSLYLTNMLAQTGPGRNILIQGRLKKHKNKNTAIP